MAAIARARLKDGYEVSQDTLDRVMVSLRAVDKKSTSALGDLAKRCQNATYKISPGGESGSLLKANVLMQDDGSISEDIRRIVKNAIEGIGPSLRVVSPLDAQRVGSM